MREKRKKEEITRKDLSRIFTNTQVGDRENDENIGKKVKIKYEYYQFR